MSARGRLITIEGIDGTGKTTLASRLEAALDERGIDVKLLREPGGADASERVRRLVKDPLLQIGARCEALLYAAARAQLIEEVIAPRLAAGGWVLLDRFVDSSLAYQGGGRQLGIDQIRTLNEFATAGLQPDRTLLLVLDAARARARSHARAGAADRLEREGDEFFARVQDAYAWLASCEADRFRILDASLTGDEVVASALAALSDLTDRRVQS
ncbi:MAG: dTMP kinase [Solirubrobacteraceae bacterium]|jgi:dTMP kinase